MKWGLQAQQEKTMEAEQKIDDLSKPTRIMASQVAISEVERSRIPARSRCECRAARRTFEFGPDGARQFDRA
jgi:hypothetical protein